MIGDSSEDVRIRAMSCGGASCLCTGAAVWACPGVKTVSTPSRQASVVRCAVHRKGEKMEQAEVPRREALAAIAFSGALSWLPGLASAAGLPPGPPAAKLCDVDCEKELENIPTTTTPSGLQNKDIVVETGDSPPVGFQVFDSSLEKGVPYIFRVGADQVIEGLDEGIMSMKAGGKRRSWQGTSFFQTLVLNSREKIRYQ